MKRTERFGFSAINASRCLCSALRARTAEKHGAKKGNDRGGLLRFCSQGRPLPPFSGIHRMPEIAFGNRSATLRISSDDGKKQTPMGSSEHFDAVRRKKIPFEAVYR